MHDAGSDPGDGGKMAKEKSPSVCACEHGRKRLRVHSRFLKQRRNLWLASFGNGITKSAEWRIFLTYVFGEAYVKGY